MNTLLSNRKNSGIAAVAIIVVVVIIIAAVGVAAYFALGNSGSGTTTTQSASSAQSTSTSQANTVSSSSSPSAVTSSSSSLVATSSSSSPMTSSSSSSSSSSASSQSSSTSTTQIASSTTNEFGYFISIKNLIGNFTQLSLTYSSGNSSKTVNETVSYFVVGTPVINGTQLTEVNFTFAGSDNSSNLNALIFFNSAGNITLAEENGQNLTGIYAQYASFVTLPFTLFLDYQQGLLKNFTAYANFQNQGTADETYGHLTLPVTTYQATNFVYQNFTASSATIKIGHLPNTNLDITTLISVTGATQTGKSGTENFEYALISATQA